MTFNYCTLFACDSPVREWLHFQGDESEQLGNSSQQDFPLCFPQDLMSIVFSPNVQEMAALFVERTQVLPHGHKQFYKWKHSQEQSGPRLHIQDLTQTGW